MQISMSKEMSVLVDSISVGNPQFFFFNKQTIFITAGTTAHLCNHQINQYIGNTTATTTRP
jgi:hypothetical protein